MSNNPVVPRGLGGATGSGHTGSSSNQVLAIKTKTGILAAGAYDMSSSTLLKILGASGQPTSLAQFIALGQNGMIDEISDFEKRGMVLLRQLLFNETVSQLHNYVAIDQAQRLVVGGNYNPSGSTALYYTVEKMVREGEEEGAKLGSSGYRYQRVYLVMTDLDGDNASARHGIDADKCAVTVKAALDTKKVTIFYMGAGGSSVDEHVAFATRMGIPFEMIHAIGSDAKPDEIGEWARHQFGLFSSFIQSKSVAIAAGQNGPTTLPANPTSAWKKTTGTP